MSKEVSKNTHIWSFFKAGGVKQAAIKSGADIENVSKLDKTLFAALACPVKGLNLDAKTLQFLDSDADGRIRYTDVIEACEWICGILKKSDELLKSNQCLDLSLINTGNPEGKILFDCANEILKTLKKDDKTCVCVSDFADTQKIFANTIFNADKIIIADATENQDLKSTILDIIKVQGASLDRSGKDGVSEESINTFFSNLKAYVDWKNQPKQDSSIFVFGSDTPSCYLAYQSVLSKLDDYFTRAEILNYDDNALDCVNPSKDDFLQALKSSVNLDSIQLRAMPIAKVVGKPELNLESSVNPAWEADLDNFKAKVLSRFTEANNSLSRDLWTQIKSKFAPYSAWISSKKDAGISALPETEIERISNSNDNELLCELLEKEAMMQDTVSNINKLEKLVRLNRDLYKLLRNFVNFEDFYSGSNDAIFQSGTLLIDRRACKLCMRVENPAAHALLSPLSYAYLVYCNCSQKGKDTFSIVSAVTKGDCDNILVGRNGIFIDNAGNIWDATVTKVITNPISISQAFWSPYKNFVRWISEFIAKRASLADMAATKKLEDTVSQASSNSAKKIDIGTLAAIGVAIGGITTAFGVIMSVLSGLKLLYLPLYFVGAILIISVPSMIIAWLKLRLRNLGPLLDANSWAVNTRAQIGLGLANILTETARVPKGSKLILGNSKGSSYFAMLVVFAVSILVIVGAVFGGYKMGLIKFGSEALGADKAQQVQVESPTQNPAQSAK